MLNSTMMVDLRFHSYLIILLLIHNTVRFTNYKKKTNILYSPTKATSSSLIYILFIFLQYRWVDLSEKTILINVFKNQSKNKHKYEMKVCIFFFCISCRYNVSPLKEMMPSGTFYCTFRHIHRWCPVTK